MIQRPQTLFFLAIIAMSLMMMLADLTYYKTGHKQNDEAAETISTVEVMYAKTIITTGSEKSELKNHSLFYFLVCIAILAFTSLLLYRNRKLQLMLTAFNFLFITASLYLMYRYSYGMNFIEDQKGEFTLNALLPAGMLFFNFLAMKGIQKDEKIIRSMDRFR